MAGKVIPGGRGMEWANIGFWAGTGRILYLYDYSARLLRKLITVFRWAGRSSGVETEKWLRAFFEFCSENVLVLSQAMVYPISQLWEDIISTPSMSLHMIDSWKKPGILPADYPQIANLPLHITEFNSSYVVCPPIMIRIHTAYIGFSVRRENMLFLFLLTFSVFFETGCPSCFPWRFRSGGLSSM